MADNLLEKASILLTPTAYNDGSMLSVKPENGDGDFTFSRGSAATRVNAQGLVENVQILSGDLVQNGSFSQIGAEEVTNGSFSQEGAELITNGDFATDSNWNLGSGWNISNGSANCDGTNLAYITQTAVLTTGKSYKVQFDIVDFTSGSIKYRDNGFVSGQSFSGVGSYTDYVVAGGGQFRLMSENFIGSIDNVSVKEVGQDWILETGWSIGDGKATTDGTINSNCYQDAVTTIGQTYKYSFDVLESGSGVIDGRFRNGGGVIQSFSSEGTYTGTFVAYNTLADFTTLSGNTASFSITNISVKEVGQDWTLGSGWSIGDGLASFDGGSDSNLVSYTNVDNGKSYKYSFTISDMTNGALSFRLGSSSSNDLRITADGTYTGYALSDGTSIVFRAESGFVGSITNVSVKEITDDTDLPRINYTDGCGSWLLEPQSTNLITYSSDLSSLNLRSNAVVTSNEVISPSGNLDADKITFDGTYSGRVEQTIAATVGQPYTISVYLKNKDLSDVTQVWIGFSTAAQGQFITITDEWQRYDITTNADGTSEYPRIQFSGTGSLYAWGFQVEQQSYATSYIPTNGSIATRLADVATNSGNSTLINSTEGVLYAEIAALADDGNVRMLSISDGSNNNSVSIEYSILDNLIRIRLRSGNVEQSFYQSTNYDFLQYHKIALSYRLNDFKLYIDGVLIHTDTSLNTPINLSELSFSNGTGGSPFYGKTKALAVYKEALTDAQLQSLTTI